MTQRIRVRFSSAQRTDLRRRKAGQSLREIGRAFGKSHVAIHFLLARHGGIAPAQSFAPSKKGGKSICLARARAACHPLASPSHAVIPRSMATRNPLFAFVACRQEPSGSPLVPLCAQRRISQGIPLLCLRAHITTALSGGRRYKHTISRTFSTKRGSFESWKWRCRCGWRPKARQMRWRWSWKGPFVQPPSDNSSGRPLPVPLAEFYESARPPVHR
jgi:hypothetical protein